MSFFSTAKLPRCSSHPRQGGRESSTFLHQLPQLYGQLSIHPNTHTHTHPHVLLRWGGIEKGGPVYGSSLSARSLSTAVQKSRSQHGSEPSGTDCCRTSRLLQTRVDPGTVCPAFLVHPFSLSHTHIDTLHIFSVNSLGSGFIDYEEDLNSSTVSVPLKYLLYKHSTPPSLEAARRMLKNTAC